MASKPTSIDEYLADVAEPQRKVLQRLRETIRQAVPEAEEGFSYGVPAFRLRGKAIAGFAAAASHCSYYPMSGSTVARLAGDLAGYETSKGAVCFPVEKPLPDNLVRKLIAARIAEL